eukprot:CAMPEP_0172934562 /NCGR_PEP_ID=MMETSP1075-20121228/221075_1 /TAXON_ID=2916 /ORGANISM="Ceratium fusus, Strain PA161109" /LENGTH=536 /DNA_ID=CAMNT_0013795917 /DNA_START=101 /DNA_END=1713 /DNA_ORIENTATION=+
MSELLGALFKRRSDVDSSGQVWESQPAKSCADASHLDALDFTAPAVTQWLQQLEKSPEEDMLQEALAEELAERGSHGPSHAPNAAVEVGAARLQQLAEAVQEARKHLKADLLAQAASREELERREAELQEREKAVDRQQEHQRLQEQARRDYPQPEWMDSIEDTLNVGVVGNSGVGKSLFINKLRRLRPHAAGWAAVGINETTKEPTAYCFPDEPRVRLWDVPGAGTAAVPSESYIQDMGLRYFDKVVVLTAGRFTEMEVVLRAELQQHGVPFFMVRTKVDIDCWNNLTDNGMDEAATVAAILEDLKQNHNVENPYLISNRDDKAYDMPRRTKVDIDCWNNLTDNGMDEAATVAAILEDLKQNHNVENPYLISNRDDKAYDMPRLLQDLFPGLQRRLDPMAPAFQPGAGVWGESWVLPEALPNAVAGMQGRWRDHFGAVYLIQGVHAHVTLLDGDQLSWNFLSFGAVYLIQGVHVHVTLMDGRSATVLLFQSNGKVSWYNNWVIDEAQMRKAAMTEELRWAPVIPGNPPLVWWWCG